MCFVKLFMESRMLNSLPTTGGKFRLHGPKNHTFFFTVKLYTTIKNKFLTRETLVKVYVLLLRTVVGTRDQSFHFFVTSNKTIVVVSQDRRWIPVSSENTVLRLLYVDFITNKKLILPSSLVKVLERCYYLTGFFLRR